MAAGAISTASVVGRSTGIPTGYPCSLGEKRQPSSPAAQVRRQTGLSGWAKIATFRLSSTTKLNFSYFSYFSFSSSSSSSPSSSSSISYFDRSHHKQRWQQRRSIPSATLATTPDGPVTESGPGSVTASPSLITLGSSPVVVPTLGIGAWAWGDRFFWNEGQWDDRKVKMAKQAFEAGMDNGINFFDTAEVYGTQGGNESEALLGKFIKERKERKRAARRALLLAVNSNAEDAKLASNDEKQQQEEEEEEEKVVIATKFAALPWRIGRGSVMDAVKASLCRLGVKKIDLYQLHWPGVWQNEAYWDGLGDVYEAGLVGAVGVSNYSASRMRAVHASLAKRAIPLASNQVHYNLLYRNPESSGVKAVCDELGVTLIAYSPIAQGILSGKYTADRPPSGPRGQIFRPDFLRKAGPVIDMLKKLAGEYDKTPTQVALNWLLVQGNVVPIPGAKTAEQAKEFAGAMGWQMTSEEAEELRALAKEVPPYAGFPIER